MRVRPHVCAAAFVCLSLLIAASGSGPGPRAGALLAGKIVHADAASVQAAQPAVPSRTPVCSTVNPHGDWGLVAVVARPAGARPGITAAVFRRLIAAADGLVYQQAEESGAPGADLVFECAATGEVRVDDVTLPTTLSDTTFDSVVADLAALGYDRPNEKYVVWFDGRPPNAPCGSADIVSDQESGDRNRVASGPDWAVSFGCNSILHETMHVLGAVGLGAPHGTGLGHCWDGNRASDVMCYPDGGRTGRLRTGPCASRSLHLDCGHDDYFAAGGVPASAYLASHWNVAGCYDRFLVDYGCPGVVAPPGTPPALRVVAGRRTSETTVRVTVRLSRPTVTTVSASYTARTGSGRVVFPPRHVIATLDLAAPQTGSSRLVLSDPEGVWLPRSLAELP